MTYTEQQLADLYAAAVSAEASFNQNGDSGSEGFELEILMETLGGREQIIRKLIDDLRAAQRRPEYVEDTELTAVTVASLESEEDLITVPRGLLGAALGAINHPQHASNATIGVLKHYAHTKGRKPAPVKSWAELKQISDLPAVHLAVQDLLGDTTEDTAINLIRTICESVNPEPQFWLDVHGFQSYLKFSEADAIASCNDNGGLYVLPLYAGEAINCKLPARMCRPAPTAPKKTLVGYIGRDDFKALTMGEPSPIFPTYIPDSMALYIVDEDNKS